MIARFPSLQWTDDFPIDVSAEDFIVADELGPRVNACTLYVENDDASACTVVVILAGKNHLDENGDLDPTTATTYTVPSGTFLPIIVKAVLSAGTSADTILGGYSR